MAKYTVKTIAIAVKNNRIAKFGEEVDDNELTVPAYALIEAGSIELVEGSDVAQEVAEAIEVIETEVETVQENSEVIETEEVVEEKPAAKKDEVVKSLTGKK